MSVICKHETYYVYLRSVQGIKYPVAGFQECWNMEQWLRKSLNVFYRVLSV